MKSKIYVLQCTLYVHWSVHSEFLKIYPLFQTYFKLCLASSTPLPTSMIKSFTVLRHFRDCIAHFQEQHH
jgi:hypothetical protein